MTTIEWWSLDEITRSTIQMHVAENDFLSMAKETKTYALWEKFQDVYEKNLSSLRLILVWLFNIKMKELQPTNSHINTFNRMLAKLSSQGLNFDEEIKALALLSSLLAS